MAEVSESHSWPCRLSLQIFDIFSFQSLLVCQLKARNSNGVDTARAELSFAKCNGDADPLHDKFQCIHSFSCVNLPFIVCLR
jgi:hypothetical protein